MPSNSAIQPYQLTALSEHVHIDDVCDAIANGLTLSKYCNQHHLEFGSIRRWINSNEEYRKKYQDALVCRDDWAVGTTLSMITDIAGFDPKSVHYESGGIKPIHDWPEEARAALEGLDYGKEGEVSKVKFQSRLKALELLGRTLGIFAEKVKTDNRETLSDLVLEANRRRGAHGNGKAVEVQADQGSEVDRPVEDQAPNRPEVGG